MTRETGQLIETEISTLDAPLRPECVQPVLEMLAKLGTLGMMLREWVRKGTRFQQISKVIARIRRNYAKTFQIGARQNG